MYVVQWRFYAHHMIQMNAHTVVHPCIYVCTLIPFPIGALNLTREEFSSIVAPTVITEVACTGAEEGLSGCTHSLQPTCSELDDAGVVCQGQLISYIGIIHTQIYMYICTYIRMYIQTNVCTYLHVPTYIHRYVRTYVHACVHVHSCTVYVRTNTHTHVHACRYICTHLCIHLRILYNILLLDTSTMVGNCVTGDVRLADSIVNTEMATREGQLEVCINNAWGAACSDERFGVSEARVACQEAGGYTREDGEEIEPLANSGAVFLFELNCAGNESSLLECPSFPIVEYECASGQDVAIRCTGTYIYIYRYKHVHMYKY